MIPGLDFIGGFLGIKESAKQFPGYIDKVFAASDAKRVDMVTHSEGGTVARYKKKKKNNHPLSTSAVCTVTVC